MKKNKILVKYVCIISYFDCVTMLSGTRPAQKPESLHPKTRAPKKESNNLIKLQESIEVAKRIEKVYLAQTAASNGQSSGSQGSGQEMSSREVKVRSNPPKGSKTKEKVIQGQKEVKPKRLFGLKWRSLLQKSILNGYFQSEAVKQVLQLR